MKREEKSLTQFITDVIAKIRGHEKLESSIVHRLKIRSDKIETRLLFVGYLGH